MLKSANHCFVRIRFCVFVALAEVFAGGTNLHAQENSPGEIPGVPWPGTAAGSETVSAIMARESARAPQVLARIRARKRRLIREGEDVAQNPHAPEMSHWPFIDSSASGPAPLPSGPFNPQAVGTSFLGAQISDTIGYVPPDSMADVGPNQIIVCVNGRIRSYTKAGVADGALNATTDNFFASVLGGSSTSDPRVRFDRLSGRWFITMITVNTPNFVLVAVSSGPTITSSASFNFYSFPADASDFGDYDTLGVDAKALYIGVNVFNGNTFANTTGFVVNKSNLLSGTLTVTAFTGLISGHGITMKHGPYTPQGVNNDDPNATQGYFIGVDATSFGTLVVRRVSNPGGTPTISANLTITVPSTASPLGGVPALGSSLGLDDLDDRLFAARMHNGSLWTAHNIEVNSSGTASSSGGRDGARWYQVTNLTSTPTLAQSGTLFDSAASNPRSFWIPSCAMSGQGHMALGCSVAGNNEHAEIAVAGRFASDTPGTIQSPTTAVNSSGTYNLNTGDPVYRWGDYSVTTVDPNDDMTMWTIQEYCNATDSWGVRVIKLFAPLPATPTNCNPASINAGTSNVNVVVTGLSTNGTGFFDPGPAFSNHISAAISGAGVTVNSITYTNPTHVTVNVSVAAGAAAGSRTVTITNPDGQSAASPAGILTIVSGTNHPPVLSAIGNKAVNEGSLLTFTNTATDPDGDGLAFSLDPGAPAGALINSSNGVFTWTPSEAQGPGTNSITVRVTDNGSPPLSDTNTFTVVVAEVNTAPSLTAISNRTIVELTTLTFTNTATDSDIPANALTFSLDPGAPTNATIGASSGVFAWTPTEAQGPGTNVITVRVTDNGSPLLSATQTFTVIVLESNLPPSLAAIADRTVHAGMTVTFTNSATDPDVPANTLTFSLDAGAPAGAGINSSNGIFIWATQPGDANTTNPITVRVTDNGAPPLSNARSFDITVMPPPFQSISLSNDTVIIAWSAIAGQNYRVQYTEDLASTNWTDLPPDVTAGGSSASTSDSILFAPQRFYRVVVVP